MTLNPADGRLTQIAAGPFALNPFIARSLLAFQVNAEFFHG